MYGESTKNVRYSMKKSRYKFKANKNRYENVRDGGKLGK